jgi:hypothetical protein
MNLLPLRPRPRFTIRAMLVLMTLVAASLAFHAYHLSWIRQRRAAIASGEVDVFITAELRKSLPFPLNRYGEPGYDRIYASIPTADKEQETQRRLAFLFPEAQIYIDILRPPESISSRTP